MTSGYGKCIRDAYFDPSVLLCQWIKFYFNHSCVVCFESGQVNSLPKKQMFSAGQTYTATKYLIGEFTLLKYIQDHCQFFQLSKIK